MFLPGESPWTGEPGRIQSIRSQRVGHDWSCLAGILSKHTWQININQKVGRGSGKPDQNSRKKLRKFSKNNSHLKRQKKENAAWLQISMESLVNLFYLRREHSHIKWTCYNIGENKTRSPPVCSMKHILNNLILKPEWKHHKQWKLYFQMYVDLKKKKEKKPLSKMLINDINTIMKEHFNRTTLIWVVRKLALTRTGLICCRYLHGAGPSQSLRNGCL